MSNFSGSDTSISKKKKKSRRANKTEEKFTAGKEESYYTSWTLCSLEFHLVTNQNKRVQELNKYLIEKSKKVL